MQLPVYFHDVQVGWLKKKVSFDSPPSFIETPVGKLDVAFLPAKGYAIIILSDTVLNNLIESDAIELIGEKKLEESDTFSSMKCSRCGEVYYEEASDGCRDLDCPQEWKNYI